MAVAIARALALFQNDSDTLRVTNWKDKFDDAHVIARECQGMIEGEILFCTDEGTLSTLYGLRDKLEKIK